MPKRRRSPPKIQPPELTASDIAFLFGNFVGARQREVSAGTWSALGPAGKSVLKAIRAQGIDLDDPEVAVQITKLKYDAFTAALVEVFYEGGGSAPDPFRFVYFISRDKYIGSAGEVASR